MIFKAVIFDLDGTLLDSLQDLAETLNSVLASHALPVHTLDEYRFLVGYGMQELIRRSLPETLQTNTAMIRMLLEEMKEEYSKTWKNNTRPYPGIAELLDWLGKTSLKQGILSNKPDAFTKLCAETLLSPWRFDLVMGHHDAIRHKPDPAGALLMAEQFGCSPEEILYIGDSSVDMNTAKAAGMFPMGVLWGFRPEEELRANGAAELAAVPDDIKKFLSGKTCRDAG